MIAAAADPNVVYVLPDKMGGVVNIVASLVSSRGSGAMPQHVVLTHNTLATDTRYAQPVGGDRQISFEYTLPVENLHAVLARLHAALPPGGGVLVSNDLLELAMLHVHPTHRMVLQILHGDHDYYYDLAVRHESVIDVFAAYSRAMFDTLRARLPQRADDVFYLPYGVPPAERVRQAEPGPLRLLFAGRLEHGQKGVLDLPAIDRALRDCGVERHWTIVGDGPDAARLRDAWCGAGVEWRGAMTRTTLLEAIADFDVFVLPTRVEGFPVALVEAMAAGLVPVVSDIRSGVPEIVDNGVNGYRLPIGDPGAFAGAIARLAGDRARLEAMSRAARRAIDARFDADRCAAAYHAMFARWRDLRRPHAARAPLPYGSRLDQPWLPNALVRQVRTLVRRTQGKPW